jgi:F420-non-reducing hydrogenase iron-sulfur subunit
MTGAGRSNNRRTKEQATTRMLVFACKWCGLIGADGAGKKRMELPASFRVIPVECAALVEPDAVIRALASGISGVAVLGCHLGGCRFNHANHAAVKRLELLKTLLDAVGIGGKRLLLAFGTAHEDHQYAEVINTFFAELKALPSIEKYT